MYKKLIFVLFILALLFSAAAPCVFAVEKQARKIVIFREAQSSTSRDKVLKQYRVSRIADLNLINASAVLISSADAKKLEKDVAVLMVEDDQMIYLAQSRVSHRATKPKMLTAVPDQTTPWGIKKINAPAVWSKYRNRGAGVKIAVLDTGININHPDLILNLKAGISMVEYTASFDDDHGHGTHVAGTIAAVDNNIGVVGVAPSAEIYAVKVMNKNGGGFTSDIINGLEWAINNQMQIVNMSMAGPDSFAFHEAIFKTVSAGVVVVAAAGNNGKKVVFPAAYPEVIAVGSIDEYNAIAKSSSPGPEVDVAAPGISIFSTYLGHSYIKFSGTSMAAPHAAGVVALMLKTHPGAYDFDNDRQWDPIEVQQKLRMTATDLGDAGADNYFGWGLVNAFAAVE